MTAARDSWRHALPWLGVLACGVGLRFALWSGYGLGDDPNYFYSYYSIYNHAGSWDPADPYQHRFGIWLPVVLTMKFLGPTEAGFIGAITCCSVVNMVLVYLLARQDWGRTAGLLAMMLMAVFPLEVLCSTLFANDVILATYTFAAFWLYRAALRDGRSAGARVTLAGTSALLLFAGFLTKPWVLYSAPLFAFEATLAWPRRRRETIVATAGCVALFGAYLGWQLHRFGDPVHHLTIAGARAIFVPYSRDILLDYPRMLFQPNQYGTLFAGFYPHALVALALLFALRWRTAGKWLLYATILLACMAAAPAHREHGHWVLLAPHIFRYLTFLSIPLCLALAAYGRELIRWRRAPALAAIGVFLVISIAHAVVLTWPTRDAFGEERRVLGVLRDLPDQGLALDVELGDRYRNFGHRPRGIISLRSEDPIRRAGEFAVLRHLVVVTGGARLPWYGCVPCIPDLGSFEPPSTWTLLTTFDHTRITPYRHEPLRVWRVS